MSYLPSLCPISHAVCTGGEGLVPSWPPVSPSLLTASPSRVLLILSPKQPWKFHHSLCHYHQASTCHGVSCLSQCSSVLVNTVFACESLVLAELISLM